MPNSTGERLKRLIPKIMAQWETRAYEEVDSAVHQKSLALRNSIPDFLEQIVVALSTTIDRNAVRVKRDRKESSRIGKKHGKERASSRDYTMEELIFEYHILRQVICEAMEEEVPLTSLEREIISCSVEQAVNDAASQFSETLRSVQERMTDALTHDLRGPITSAKLSAQIILQGSNTNDDSWKTASRIVNAMNRLEAMIRDLLDASKLRAGLGLALELKEFDLDLLVREVVDDLNFTYNNRIMLNSQGPCKGNWNRDGLRRALENLITNAIKYGEQDKPIRVQLKQAIDTVDINVHNTGTPIPEDEMDILFQQFRRARNVETKPGWGLGLAVVKGVAEGHGGSVKVSSNREDGTIFSMTIPRNIKEKMVHMPVTEA